jgi:hypothetical protein
MPARNYHFQQQRNAALKQRQDAPELPEPNSPALKKYITPATEVERQTLARQEPEARQEQRSYREIMGFGRDIPLALAIGQIVPPDYPYAFVEGVNPGIKIDWDGGKPWNIVLSEAIGPHGLEFEIFRGQIYISKTETVSEKTHQSGSARSGNFYERHVSPQETAELEAKEHSLFTENQKSLMPAMGYQESENFNNAEETKNGEPLPPVQIYGGSSSVTTENEPLTPVGPGVGNAPPPAYDYMPPYAGYPSPEMPEERKNPDFPWSGSNAGMSQ